METKKPFHASPNREPLMTNYLFSLSAACLLAAAPVSAELLTGAVRDHGHPFAESDLWQTSDGVIENVTSAPAVAVTRV